MWRWFKRFINKLDANAVTFVRPHVQETRWVASVHQEHLYLAKGSTVFVLGPCQQVVDRAFETVADPLPSFSKGMKE